MASTSSNEIIPIAGRSPVLSVSKELRGPTVSRIIDLLNRKGPQFSNEVIAHLGDASPRYVYELLRKMTQARMTIRPKWGLYCLPQQIGSPETDRRRSKRKHKDEDQCITSQPIRQLIDIVLNEHLVRCGGACLLQVRSITRRIRKRYPKSSVAKTNRRVDTYLKSIENAEFWGHAQRDDVLLKKHSSNISNKLYAIRWPAHRKESEKQTKRIASFRPNDVRTSPIRTRKKRTTIADAAIELIRYVLTESGNASLDLIHSRKCPDNYAKAIRRLSESGIIECDSGVFSIAPQDDPARVQLIKNIANGGLAETIRELCLEYADGKHTETGKPLFKIGRLRRHVREQIPFLKAAEMRPAFNEVLEALIKEEILTQLDGPIYRFNSSESPDPDRTCFNGP